MKNFQHPLFIQVRTAEGPVKVNVSHIQRYSPHSEGCRIRFAPGDFLITKESFHQIGEEIWRAEVALHG